jgi:hypothetical protein
MFMVVGCGRTAMLPLAAGDGGSNIQPGEPVSNVWEPPVAGQCSTGFSSCGKGDGLRCYDLGHSNDHCGACGHACAPGIACLGGSCQQYRCGGALSFKAGVYTSLQTYNKVSPVLGDFDGDDTLDLVGTPTSGGAMSLLYGAGDGTFPDRQPLAASLFDYPSAYWGGLAADVDGDGILDLVSSNSPTIAGYCDHDCAIRVNRGLGAHGVTFAAPVTYPTGNNLAGFALADLDGDGHLDMAAAVGPGLSYWRGQSGGRFEQQTISDGPSSTTGTSGAVIAMDWNGDGILDLVNQGTGANVTYRLGHGNGSFDPAIPCALAWGLIGDLDHDGRPDIISASNLLMNIEGCRPNRIVELSDWPKDGGMAFADFNGDGNLDVVADNNTSITVWVGNGQSAFPHAVSMSAPTHDQWPVGDFRVGDLNRDGKLDFIFSRGDGWGVFLNTCN